MKYLRKLASIKFLLMQLLWLMIVLIIGTIEQKNIGLLAAQQKYFFSTYFSIGPIMLPGGGLTISLFTISLFVQLILNSQFTNRKKIGIHLAHIGTMIMFLGAFHTFLFGTEGSLIFKEGESKNYFYSNKQRALYIKNISSNQTIKKIDLNTQDKLSSIKILKYYPGCKLINNTNPKNNEIGFSRMFTFQETETADESLKCVEFIFDAKLYRVFENMPKKQTVMIDSIENYFDLNYETISIPFQVKLIDFQKKFHQGTMVSKSFKSIVTILDNNLETKHIIEMNHPLRYKGYTFYQSSFSENSEGESSELTVVKNEAAFIPYLSTIMIFLGLLIHFILNFRKYFYEK